MFTSSIFLLKTLPDGGRTWIYDLSTRDHPYALQDQSKAKSWGLPTSPEYLPLVSTSSRCKKSKIGPLWEIWYFWITSKGFPTPCSRTSLPFACWSRRQICFNFPKSDGKTCLQATTLATKLRSNSFVIMTKCWVGHYEILYTIIHCT